jgi:hypothetical protein
VCDAIDRARSPRPNPRSFAAHRGRAAGGQGNLAVELVQRKPEVILALGGDVAPIPAISRVGVIWNPDHADDELQETQTARTLGVQIQSLEVRGAADFEGAFQAAIKGRVEALIVVSSRQMSLNRVRILEFGGRNKLPLVCGWDRGPKVAPSSAAGRT